MKKLNKIALSVMAVVAVGIGFSGCDIADESKAPSILIDYDRIVTIHLFSKDDETIINNMTIIGRNGKCDIKDLGTQIKYGKIFTYNAKRFVMFDSNDCPPKNGKYEIELSTNFGTYHYEMATTR